MIKNVIHFVCGVKKITNIPRVRDSFSKMRYHTFKRVGGLYNWKDRKEKKASGWKMIEQCFQRLLEVMSVLFKFKNPGSPEVQNPSTV